MNIRVIGLSAILLSVLVTSHARADEVETSTLTNSEAARLLSTFSKAYRPKEVEARLEALRVLEQYDHPKIATRLLKLLRRKDNDPAIQVALFKGLAVQQQAKKKVVKKVAVWLMDQAKEARKGFAGDAPGFRIDPKTGDPDLTSDEGRRVLETAKQRGLVLHAAVCCLRKLSPKPPRNAERLIVFLQHPHDPPVQETLAAIAAWKVTAALPQILELYRTYPAEDAYDSNWFVPAAKLTQGHSRAAYLLRFGHPDKKRHRPEIVRSLRACLAALTGRTFETPDDLARWMRSPEGRRVGAAP